jgi:hypothetical protein
MEDLAETIRERCAGAWPIIYGGAELYGSPPNGDVDTEVLLARGAIALLDPLEQPGAELAGPYELLFYDENDCEPKLRVPIGPNIDLCPQSEVEAHPGRLSAPRQSMANRMSMGASVAACFDFAVQGCRLSALTFDRDVDAQGFVRDFSVRLRLAKASLKTVREKHSNGHLQGQIFTMRQNSLTARAGRIIFASLMCILGLMVFHGCSIFFNEDKTILEVVARVLGDTAAAVEVLTGAAQNLGNFMCHSADNVRTVSAAAVETCANMYSAAEAHSCIQDLSGRAHVG